MNFLENLILEYKYWGMFGVWVVYKISITTLYFKNHKRDKYEDIEKQGDYGSATEACIKTHNEIKNNHILADKVEEWQMTDNQGNRHWVIEVTCGIFKFLFLPFKL